LTNPSEPKGNNALVVIECWSLEIGARLTSWPYKLVEIHKKVNSTNILVF